ncbi:restriction endonuclease [Moorena sp. SIOASIH]|uniref:restriction endonuclease n=1 Tax=Moorena sp. SIOASIH TaxID=2607817 RepID=UPI0025ED0D1F|nr:restriction endonuclease [Moorena sp. SIOASIH]
MDEVVRKVAALGLPGVILLITMATTGLTGAAAITAALAMLGPFGMIGGIGFLGVVGIAADGLSKFGLEALLVGIYKQRQEEGESKASLCKEIKGLMVSRDLKRKLKAEVKNGKSSVEDRRESKSSKNIDEQLDAIDQMTGREFEKFLAKLFKQLGYQVKRTPATADYGADLVIKKGDIKAVVQAKRKQGSVGIKAVQEVTGAIGYYQANLGLVITNSKFTETAKELAAKTDIMLFDRDDFKKLIKNGYDVG